MRTILLMLAILATANTCFAADPTPTKVSSDVASYNPSIVCIPGTTKQVAAYTLETPVSGSWTSTTRSVIVKVSTDAGVTWTTCSHSLSLPASSISLTDMDEPQLAILQTSSGAPYVVLVVRAWNRNKTSGGHAGTDDPQTYHGQIGTIFYQSGIYCAISIDPFTTGSTNDWSNFDDDGTRHAGFTSLDEINGSGTTPFETLGHPV